MSDQDTVEDGSQDESNSFSNDGSFLEQFKKLQEQKTKAEEERKKKEQEERAKLSKPLFSRVNKNKIKLGGFKKGFSSGIKGKKPLGSVAKAFSDDTTTSDSDHVPITSSATVSPAGSKLSATSTEPTPPPVKKSRLSDAPPPGVAIPGQISQPVPSSSVEPSSAASQPGPSTTAPVRKRKSRFSDAPPKPDDATMASVISSFNTAPQPQPSGLTAAQKQQILEQIEMNKLVAEIKTATAQAVARKQNEAGSNPVYEYDSDEDTEGGTWEHKKRMQEMQKTYSNAKELTEMNKGKHHIGDFLPPEELSRFVERVSAVKEGRTPDFSDYKEHKLTEDNVGFKLLQKAGWTEGTGLGSSQEGIVDPINKGKQSFDQSGVGAEPPAEVKQEDDTFDIYRKRMMLAYRFRPNPLNNPRRPYY